MNIAFNLLFLHQDTRSGTGKHIEELLEGFAEAGLLDSITLFVQDTFETNYFNALSADSRLRAARRVICAPGPLPAFVFKCLWRGKKFFRELFLNYCVLPGKLRASGCDLLFSPYNKAFNYRSGRLPAVVVVHDLYHRNVGGDKRLMGSLRRALVANMVERRVRQADFIVTVSEHVRQDILRWFDGIPPEKIVVIPNTIAIGSVEEPSPGVVRPFLLCVSEHGRHKNHLTLLRAFNSLKSHISQRLVLLGRDREATPEIRRYILESGLSERVILLSGIPDSQRNWLYRNTDLLIAPSLHEGFGRTPVEAAMHGAPVLSSRETSLPEATMERVAYYEPATDAQALAEAIDALLREPVPEEKRRRTASILAAAYEPKAAALRYLELFAEVLAGRKGAST